jgi:formylmethanofuran dehydrogenase subunit C
MLEMRAQNDISEDELKPVDCDICNPNFESNQSQQKIENLERITKDYQRVSLSLLEFVRHEVNHEYEKAKRCIFGKDKKTFEE